jgi:hypothetical protein
MFDCALVVFSNNVAPNAEYNIRINNPQEIATRCERGSPSAMPARDLYHEVVKNALIKDGWTITHDPYHLRSAGKHMYVDLAAEQILAAERETEKIAVEIKSFLGASLLDDLENAIGKFVLYRTIMSYEEPDRRVFLAIPFDAAKVFEEPFGQQRLESNVVRAIIFDPSEEVIVKWIP